LEYRFDTQEFIGVGAHLFAIGCKMSFDLGFEGFVAFHAKSQLLKHYENTLGATVIEEKTRRMIIGTDRAKMLLETYFE
jgi:hypothetical protein